MNKIVTNYREIIRQIDLIDKKSIKCDLLPRLIAVSKTFPIEDIQVLINEGHEIFGENKVQEADQKWSVLRTKNENIELHLIGPLQSNKVKQALNVFDVIQTLDREKIALKISRLVNDKLDTKSKKFFVQVNIGNESQKSGVEVKQTKKFVNWCINDLNLNVIGLMCIPPFNLDSEPFFKSMKRLCNESNLEHLSMGMSEDYVSALENGATYIRVGSGIFGKRN